MNQNFNKSPVFIALRFALYLIILVFSIFFIVQVSQLQPLFIIAPIFILLVVLFMMIYDLRLLFSKKAKAGSILQHYFLTSFVSVPLEELQYQLSFEGKDRQNYPSYTRANPYNSLETMTYSYALVPLTSNHFPNTHSSLPKQKEAMGNKNRSCLYVLFYSKENVSINMSDFEKAAASFLSKNKEENKTLYFPIYYNSIDKTYSYYSQTDPVVTSFHSIAVKEFARFLHIDESVHY